MSTGICRARRTLDGAGLDPAVVPGALHAALTVLEKWGTMSLRKSRRRASPTPRTASRCATAPRAPIRSQLKFFENWPGNKAYWQKADGSQYKPGETIKLPTLARTLKRMVEAERAAKGGGRTAGIVAARDRFYKGDIAQEMVAFLQKHGAPFDASDFADYFARIEEPAKTTYRGYTVYKHGFGSQGPVLLQALNILENFDLPRMGYGSADYLHTVIEAMKLAYADRDTYYADPAFVKVPAEGLLSKEYAKERAALIDPKKASTSFIAGDPLKHDSKVKQWTFWKANENGAPRHATAEPGRFVGYRQGHHAHGGHRQGRQHLRRHAERRLGARRGDSRRHRHRHERARRAVLARQDAREPDPPAGAAALHADAEHGASRATCR